MFLYTSILKGQPADGLFRLGGVDGLQQRAADGQTVKPRTAQGLGVGRQDAAYAVYIGSVMPSALHCAKSVR